MGKDVLFLRVTLLIGFCLITYNMYNSTLLDQNKAASIRESVSTDHGLDQVNLITRIPKDRKRVRRLNPKFHVAVAATDSIYSKWQCRVMYYWYKKFKDSPRSDMGGFTRVLHSGRPDNLMEKIPSFVVKPLPDDKGYIVLSRSYAFQQWLEKATIKEDYILMGEPDHIFVNPLPNLAYRKNPVAYPFFYIKPAENEVILRKFYPDGPITNIDPIGSSPVIISKVLLKQIVTTWMNVSWRIKNDPEADKALDWVQEMYAYAIASALHGVKHNLHADLILQPPREPEVGKRYIIHYTYPCDYNLKGELTFGKKSDWGFNKRDYQKGPPQNNLTLPPPETVVVFQLSAIQHQLVPILVQFSTVSHSTPVGANSGAL